MIGWFKLTLRWTTKQLIWQLNVNGRRSHKVFQKTKDLWVLLESENAIGILFHINFQFQIFWKQEPCDPMGWNHEFWRVGIQGGISRHHRSDFDNFECSRSTWLWWMTEKTVVNRTHIRPPTEGTGMVNPHPQVLLQINGKYFQVNNKIRKSGKSFLDKPLRRFSSQRPWVYTEELKVGSHKDFTTGQMGFVWMFFKL